MSSWAESQYDFRLNPSYLPPPDHIDGTIRGADHPLSMHTGYSYASRHSPISSRQTYSSGLYGPRPQPAPPDTMQTFPTLPMQVPGMTELEEADNEYMEVEPGAILAPTFPSEYDDEPPSQGKRRFIGGFIRGLKKIPRAMKRGFSDTGEIQTPPGLAYQQTPYQSPYMPASQPEESEEAPPYDTPAEHIDGNLRYVEGMNMRTELVSPDSPSRTPSHSIRAPRSESQLTYQSLTNPSARHVSQHGSLHHAQRSSPPRTVRNPDPVSPTEGSDITNGNPSRPPSHHTPEPELGPRTSRISPLEQIRRPTVTIQSPTDSAVYIESQHADDYVGMAAPVDPLPEPSIPSQFARIRKFFRDLNDLPWVSPNVTVDFNPTDSERARFLRSGGSGRSWYTGRLHDLDLLDGGGSSTRRLTAPSGHSLGPAPGSSTTLAPHHGSGSASSSEGASAHLPAAHALPSHPYPVPQLALSPQPLYLYPATYHAMPPPPPAAPLPPSPSRQPNGTEQVSPQPSGQSDVPRPPYLYLVPIPPGYLPSSMDLSRPIQMQPAYLPPYPPPV